MSISLVSVCTWSSYSNNYFYGACFNAYIAQKPRIIYITISYSNFLNAVFLADSNQGFFVYHDKKNDGKKPLCFIIFYNHLATTARPVSYPLINY